MHILYIQYISIKKLGKISLKNATKYAANISIKRALYSLRNAESLRNALNLKNFKFYADILRKENTKERYDKNDRYDRNLYFL